MYAISGFSGPPDDELAMRMRRVLVHRGGEGHQIASAWTGTIGYLARFSQSPRNRLGAGIYQERDQAIALVGQLTFPSKPRPLLAELLRRFRACRTC